MKKKPLSAGEIFARAHARKILEMSHELLKEMERQRKLPRKDRGYSLAAWLPPIDEDKGPEKK